MLKLYKDYIRDYAELLEIDKRRKILGYPTIKDLKFIDIFSETHEDMFAVNCQATLVIPDEWLINGVKTKTEDKTLDLYLNNFMRSAQIAYQSAALAISISENSPMNGFSFVIAKRTEKKEDNVEK